MIPVFLWSQLIKGHLENENREPVSGAAVTAGGARTAIYSDPQGNFNLEGFN